MQQKTPTTSQFNALLGAYNYFNKRLFKGKLPNVILNLSRQNQAAGFVAPFRWRSATKQAGEKGTLHELSINPEILLMPPEYVYGTLVHEQVHIWQHEYGKPSRTGYHNQQWARKMEAIGLMPSSTGRPGGKKTGQQMSDYPIKDGPFMVALKEMPKEFFLPFVSTEGDYLSGLAMFIAEMDQLGQLEDGQEGMGRPRMPKRPKSEKSKTTYVCGSCDMKVWGKPNLAVSCMDCGQQLEVVE